MKNSDDKMNIMKIERLKAIKDEMNELSDEKSRIEKELPEKVIYQDNEGKWTRFSKTDNSKELIEKGSFFRSNSVPRFSTKIESLKNQPKD